MYLNDIDTELKVEYMIKGLDDVIQKSLSESLRPITYHELKAWFKDLDNCVLHCYCKISTAKINASHNGTEFVNVEYSDKFEKCSVYFENNDIDYGTVYIRIDSADYAYPPLNVNNYPMYFYVNDEDECMVEIKNFLKSFYS